jgi:hypothetical protein
LARHPLLGRSVEAGLRELAISRGKTGYLALYRFYEADSRVLILSIRHQREFDWKDSQPKLRCHQEALHDEQAAPNNAAPWAASSARVSEVGGQVHMQLRSRLFCVVDPPRTI